MLEIKPEDYSKTILAFDFGGARTGVAIKPAEQEAVEPLLTLDSNDRLLEKIQELIDLHNPALLIVGRPRNLEGEDTDQTKKAERFAQALQEIYNGKVELQDEALSTQESATRIPKRLASRSREFIDQYAACIILEDYLKKI